MLGIEDLIRIRRESLDRVVHLAKLNEKIRKLPDRDRFRNPTIADDVKLKKFRELLPLLLEISALNCENQCAVWDIDWNPKLSDWEKGGGRICYPERLTGLDRKVFTHCASLGFVPRLEFWEGEKDYGYVITISWKTR